MGPRRFIIVLTGLLTACGLIVGPASGSCAFLIEWNGVLYGELNIDQAPRFGPSLGEGTVPACDDTGSSGCSRLHGEDDQSIAIYRLPEVDPHVAFGALTPWGTASRSSPPVSSPSCLATRCTRPSTGHRGGQASGEAAGTAASRSPT